MLQNLGSDHLTIQLIVPLSLVFRFNERLPSLNFQKARWDDFAFYFNSHCSTAEEYSSVFLSFGAVPFASLTLNALLAIWCSGQTARFLSLLAKTVLAYLPTALSVALRLPFCFQQAQHAQVFLLNPALFCTLFAGLGSTSKSATCLLLLSDSRSVLSSIFPFTLISCSNCFLFPPVLSGYNGSLDTRFSRPTNRLMSWPDGSATCSLSNPFFYLSYLLFSILGLEAYCLI